MQTGKFGSVSSMKKESYYQNYQNQIQIQILNQKGEGRSSKRGSGVIERILWDNWFMYFNIIFDD